MKIKSVPDPAVVKLLLEQDGIEINIKTKIGKETPLHLICSRENSVSLLNYDTFTI